MGGERRPMIGNAFASAGIPAVLVRVDPYRGQFHFVQARTEDGNIVTVAIVNEEVRLLHDWLRVEENGSLRIVFVTHAGRK
jgi:hypothetical protein